MRASKTKILFGKKSRFTYFGRRGHSKGMYTGGFDWYVYGVKGIFAITKYIAWGDMCRNNPNLL